MLRLLVVISSLWLPSSALEAKSIALEKVTLLLQELLVKVKAEGKAAAKDYDDFACFCKREADDAVYKLEQTEKEQDRLTSRLRVQEAERDERQETVNVTTAKMETLQASLDDLNAKNNEAKAQFNNVSSDFLSAIHAVDYCISELESSLSQIRGKQQAALLSKFSDIISASVQYSIAKKEQKMDEAVLALVAKKAVQSPHAYETGLRGIIKSLQFLKANFKAQLSQEDAAEISRLQSVRENLRTTRNSFVAAKDTLASAQKGLEANLALIGELSSNLADADSRHEAATDFLNTLKADCQDKAAEFDSDSELRSDEIAALTEALRVMTSQAVVKGFRNNLDRRGAEEEAAASLLTRRARKAVLKSIEKNSFIQIDSHTERKRLPLHESVAKALALLSKGGRHSPLVATAFNLIQTAQASGAPFDKVNSLIRGLIAKLEAQLNDSQDAEESCKSDLEAAVNSRNGAKDGLLTHQTELATAKRELKDTKKSLLEFGEQLKAFNSALVDLTNEYNTERTRLQKVIDESREAMQAVLQAVDIMAKFYKVDVTAFKGQFGSPSLFQASKRKGGAQIVSLLQVIATDFSNALKAAEAHHAANESQYTDLSSELNSKISTAEDNISEGKTRRSRLENSEISLTESVEDSENLLAAKEGELAALKEECADSGLSYEEKRQRRREEIEALKEALEILRAYKPKTST